ncbi:MAG: hypothetical protein MR487_12850 [Lachnospiraceae bacterium]|nr:hypothetical protein [Lachnospiraceae bacterium]
MVHTAWDARQISEQLKSHDYRTGHKKARRYMNETGIDPIYPKINLSRHNNASSKTSSLLAK